LNELGVRVSTANPTEVAASLVFLVQSPSEGLFVPNATLVPAPGAVTVAVVAVVDGTETDVDPDVEAVVGL